MEVNKKVTEIIKEKLIVNEVSSDDNLIEDLGADSLDIIEIVMALESEFHIVIYDEEVDKNLTTVGHLIDFIQEKVDKNPYPHLD
jgi:acyl carrier protein